ncbi:MAG: hypothetical protein EB127_16845 [Alphaproteobacteria bacterium]|nr:hypothetical protein [Alphaproteobacteria bacterium]
MIDKLLKRKETTGLFAFIIGFGIVVMLLHHPISSQKVLALSPAEFENREVKADGKCYKYRVEDASCQITSSK